nr:hypothetical protein [Bacteroidota bacterium]
MNVIKYRKPDEVKDSAVEWVYRIPIDWTVCKIKHLASLKTGNSITADDKDEKYSIPLQPFYPYIGTKDIDVNNSRIEYDNGLFIPKNTKFNVANKGTTLICIEGGSAGRKIGYLEQDVCYVNKLCNLKSNDKNVNRLLYYFLKSNYFMAQFINKTTGIIPGISTDDFKNITTFLPPNIELRQIANFLNIKTTQFDSIIAKKELLIRKLEEAKKSLISEVVTGKVKIIDGEMVPRQPEEMKDSGVEWLGMIPKDWEVTPIKRLFRIKKKPIYKENNVVLSLTQRGLKIKDLQNNEGQHASSYSGYQEVLEDDFVMNHMDLLTGFVDCSTFIGVTSPDYRVFRIINSDICCKEFYLYYFQMCYKNKIFYGYGQGVSYYGRWRLQTEAFYYFPVVKFNYDQQVNLAQFIDTQVNFVDNLIKKLDVEITLLKQAKQSLISEAVTGKIDLRDWEIIEVGEVQ